MIVCTKCQRQMRPKKNGVSFTEMAQDQPYKLWMADLLECQDCGAQVLVTNALQKPLAEHYQPDFAEKLESYGPQWQSREWTRDPLRGAGPLCVKG